MYIHTKIMPMDVIIYQIMCNIYRHHQVSLPFFPSSVSSIQFNAQTSRICVNCE